MKHYSTLFGLLIYCALATAPLRAQENDLYIGAGIATIRGETTDQPLLQNEFGKNYTVKYGLKPFKDERVVAVADFSFTEINLQRSFGSGMNTVNFRNALTQSYLGVGVRYYHNKNLNKYNPYPGQFMPFVGFSVGSIRSIRSVNRTSDMPSYSFKQPQPVSDPTGGYEFTEGSTYELNGQVEAGFVLVLSPAWAIEASAQARPGISDSWDGVEGTHGGKDWFVSAGFGMHFRF